MSVPAPIDAVRLAAGGPVTKEPFVYQIELTNHCPYACIGCPRQSMTRPLGFMDAATYRRCIDAVPPRQIAVQMPLGLHRFGESLLHPELAACVGYASARKVPTISSCNPGHLTPQIGEDLFRADFIHRKLPADCMCPRCSYWPPVDAAAIARILATEPDQP